MATHASGFPVSPGFARRMAPAAKGHNSVDATTVIEWMRAAAESIHRERDYLTQLDAAIGDADHGLNMDRGFSAVLERIQSRGDLNSPGEVLAEAGEALLSVGSASGALWGVAFCGAGHALGDARVLGGPEIAVMLEQLLASVVKRGAAAEGDKTMVDVLAPAARAFRERIAAAASVPEALDVMCSAANDGMRATVPLQAAKGRAAYLGERSVGHQDPGATSAVTILVALDRTVSAVEAIGDEP